jgi:uracil-DNA glycosylase family 4
MKDAISYLRRRGSLSGGVVFTIPAEPPAEQAPAPARDETVVRTSPVKGTDVHDAGLSELERMVSECTRCVLHETRNRTVFGDGDPSARIVFIGEAPGRDEDLQGLPFVGRAGKLLDRMIEAIGFSRSNVYIANILTCRPPGNRDPREDEVAACGDYLARQIELIDPVIICALGRVAGQNLLGKDAPLRVLRTGEHHYNGIRVIVTYHPAALLRNPAWKKGAWEDLQKLRALYDDFTGADTGK